MSDAFWTAFWTSFWSNIPATITAIGFVITAIGSIVALVQARKTGAAVAENTTKIDRATHDVSAVKRVAENCEHSAALAAKEAARASLESSMANKGQQRLQDYLDTSTMVSGDWRDYKAKTDLGALGSR